MTENKNNKLDELLETATKLVKEGSEKAKEIFNDEKTKAKIRSDIGHTKRELTKAYEELGRCYYAAVENGGDLPDFTDLINGIRSKERVIALLNEKIDDTITKEDNT